MKNVFNVFYFRGKKLKKRRFSFLGNLENVKKNVFKKRLKTCKVKIIQILLDLRKNLPILQHFVPIFQKIEKCPLNDIADVVVLCNTIVMLKFIKLITQLIVQKYKVTIVILTLRFLTFF